MSQITVPSTIIADVRQGAHTTLGNAAEGILRATARPDRERDPSCYAEPLVAFDGARGLLNAMGWRLNGAAVHVATDCGPALIEALREAIALDPESADLAAYFNSLAAWTVGRGNNNRTEDR